MGFNSWKHSSFMSSCINFSTDCLGKEYGGYSHRFPKGDFGAKWSRDMTFFPEFRLLCDLTVSDYVMDSVATGDSKRRHHFFFFFSLLIFEVFCGFFFGVIFVLFWGGDILDEYFNNPVNLIQLLQLSNAEISKLSIKSQIVNISSFAGHMVPISTTFLTSVVMWKQL